MSIYTGQLEGHDYIYVPGSSESSLVLLLLHGTGGDESNLIQLGEDINPDAHFLSPRGNVVENGQRRFFKRLSDGVFDEADLKKRSKALTKFIESAVSRHQLAGKTLIAVGYSNGANIAAAVMILYPEVINNAVLFRPMIPLKPVKVPNLKDAKVLMMSGIQDPIVSYSNAEELKLLLQSCGARMDMHWLPTGHRLTGEDVSIAKKWVAEL